jgi:endonuclease IV
MVDELTRCEALGVEALVFHPGSHMNGGATKPQSDEATEKNDDIQSEPQAPARGGLEFEPHSELQRDCPSLALRVRINSDAEREGIERIAESLDEVHRRCAGFRKMVLLESTAGQGSAIGWHFGQLAAILDRVRESGRLGVCLDTCHLFAAGYDFRTAEGYAAMIDELERTVGVSRVRCIHTNDSKRELGSRVDRHEHIGKGMIGKTAFAHFVNDQRFVDVPFILETPKGVDGRGTDLDKVNLKRLRSLIVG